MPMTIKEKFNISGKVAIITGGAGMLGREFARTLLEYGGDVVIADISREKGEEALNELKQDLKGKLSYEYVDITSKDSVNEMVKAVQNHYGKIDILINNAALDPKFDKINGFKQDSSFEDYPLELWERAIATNLTGAFLFCQAVGKIMAIGKGGVIVNVASELGVIAPDHRIYIKKSDPDKITFKPIDYPVTKAALIHMTRYLASYWRDKNIRVNALCPAAVYTSQGEELVENIKYRTILGRMSRKDEFNGAMIFLVSEASSYMTGANLIVDGGRTVW